VTDVVTAVQMDAWVRRFAALVATNREHLTQLDAAMGDADHGSNMDRGLKAVVAALDAAEPSSAGARLKAVGMTLVSTVGGTSGPLFGTLFIRMGSSLGDVQDVTGAQFATALRAGLEGVLARGKPELGDKTMYDALGPAVDALDEALGEGAELPAALSRACAAAEDGRDATATMVARKGRGSYLGERTVGHQDPGATSIALLVQAAVETF
jgi:phosphoenolpyruvate---glycerone phosphotransferase subunit DhaL